MKKNARLEVGLPIATKQLIERAAALQGVTLSTFLVDTAAAAAEMIVTQHEQQVASCAATRQLQKTRIVTARPPKEIRAKRHEEISREREIATAQAWRRRS